MGRLKEHYTAAQDSAARSATIGDLAAGRTNVHCGCNRCGHHAMIPIAMLAGRFGPQLPVPEIGARLRCSGCGSKDVTTSAGSNGRDSVSRAG